DGIRDRNVTGVQTCALPIWSTGSTIRSPGSSGFFPDRIGLFGAELKISSLQESPSRREGIGEGDVFRGPQSASPSPRPLPSGEEIGRASCRERVQSGGEERA